MNSNNQQAFFALVKAGLWEQDVRLLRFDIINFKEVYRFAEEQSVIGLVASGLEHVLDVKVPKEEVLQFVGQALQLEQRNLAMNSFIAKLIVAFSKHDIRSVLIKGQGVAQCYEKPLWRACGDIDILLDEENYKKAYLFLLDISTSKGKEDVHRRHLGFEIDSFLVELHGTLRGNLSKKMDNYLDEAQLEVMNINQVRIWRNNETDVFLPAPLQDVVIVFTHILQHFYQSGIGLRQICDWCRLLWRYHSELDLVSLECRICKMGVMNEWKVFSSLAVDYLGMPVVAVPFYSSGEKWKKKAGLIVAFIMETGNFGHNRDMSYLRNKPFVVRKFMSMNASIIYSYKRFKVFPQKSLFFFCKYILTNVKELFSSNNKD